MRAFFVFELIAAYHRIHLPLLQLIEWFLTVTLLLSSLQHYYICMLYGTNLSTTAKFSILNYVYEVKLL